MRRTALHLPRLHLLSFRPSALENEAGGLRQITACRRLRSGLICSSGGRCQRRGRRRSRIPSIRRPWIGWNRRPLSRRRRIVYRPLSCCRRTGMCAWTWIRDRLRAWCGWLWLRDLPSSILRSPLAGYWPKTGGTRAFRPFRAGLPRRRCGRAFRMCYVARPRPAESLRKTKESLSLRLETTSGF